MSSRFREENTYQRVTVSVTTYTNNHLMTGPKGNSKFCFPEITNVSRVEAEANIEVEGKQN